MTAKKPKPTVWHKRRGKIIPAKNLKEQSSQKREDPIETNDKLSAFAKNFSDQIKNAVEQQK